MEVHWKPQTPPERTSSDSQGGRRSEALAEGVMMADEHKKQGKGTVG
jgi:hypothetical protein